MQRPRERQVLKGTVALILGVVFATTAMASDIAFFVNTQDADRFDNEFVFDEVAEIMDAVSGAFVDLQQFDGDTLDMFLRWVEEHMDDGKLDVIWLIGQFPDFELPGEDERVSDTLIQLWLQHGNMLVQAGDLLSFLGLIGADDLEDLGESLTDLLELFDEVRWGMLMSWVQNTLPIVFHVLDDELMQEMERLMMEWFLMLAQVVDPWQVEDIFGAAPTDLEAPFMIRNRQTNGYLGFMNQASGRRANRVQMASELLNEWVTQEAIGYRMPVVTDVKAEGKLVTTWAEMKQH